MSLGFVRGGGHGISYLQVRQPVVVLTEDAGRTGPPFLTAVDRSSWSRGMLRTMEEKGRWCMVPQGVQALTSGE